MKIKHKDLQQLYKNFIMENIPDSQKDCPPSKEIINFFRAKLSEKQKTKIIDHITHCYYCAQEFEFILQTLRYEGKLNEEIGNLIRSENDKTTLKTRAKKIPLNSGKKQKKFIPVLSWKYALLPFAALLIISALIFFPHSEKEEFRGGNLNQVQLVEPVDGKYSKSQLVFRWNEVKETDYYMLELFDETLLPVWKNNRISKNRALLPTELVKKLSINKTYLWTVTAFFPDGRRVESDIEEFILIK
jgi:hypothetical protein